MEKAIGYVRLSTRRQEKQTNSLEHHLTKLHLYGLERNQIIIDIETGTKSDRAGYQKILEMVRTGEVNKVVVARFDRFIRSSLDWELAIKELTISGAELEILDEQRIDLTTPDGLLFSRIRAAFAQAEVEELSLRSRKGWEGLRRRKIAMNPPFGYFKNSEHRHQLDTVPFLCLLETREEMSRAAIARDVVELFFRCRSLRSTIRALNEKYGIQRYGDIKRPGFLARGMFRFSTSGLKQWLNSSVHRGHLVYKEGKEIYYNTHPDERLITEAEYREIQAILEENWQGRGWGFRATRYPMSGLVACAVCRGNCYSCRRVVPDKITYAYYQCKNAKLKACDNKKTIRMQVIENAVIDALCQKAEQIAAIAMSKTERIDPPELQQLKVQLASLRAIGGKNSAIATAINQLEQQIVQFEHRLLEENEQSQVDRSMLISVFSDPLYFKSLDLNGQRRVFHGLVEKVLVRDGAIVEIRLKV